ncbi:MAG: acetyl-CoA carboxylase biotin carboxyl carrier protein [Candidatus Sumerlaeota bacterium]|nr:acetyl-CoA carboxylase biotin carboxyl carrier protein [Candidatus Sumerlaeota bacterium]
MAKKKIREADKGQARETAYQILQSALGATPLDPETLRSLIMLFKETGVSDFELKTDKLRLKVSMAHGRVVEPIVCQAPPVPPSLRAGPPAAAAQEAPAAAGPAPEAPTAAPDGAATIASPMVGTFYRAPAPDADPYVQIGSRVSENTILCIVEAMKIMNEIKAEMRGTVVDILVENGQPVEYGQPMFRIMPG